MQKFSLAINELLASQLTARAKKKKMSTASYLRRLIELGLAQENAKEPYTDKHSDRENLDKKMLAATLETLYICRNIILNADGDLTANQEKLDKCIAKALEGTAHFFSETIEN